MQLYAECPSRGIYNQYVGQADLTHAFDGEFNSARFELPAGLVNTLRTVPTDCKLKLATTLNASLGTFRFDRGGFIQP